MTYAEEAERLAAAVRSLSGVGEAMAEAIRPTVALSTTGMGRLSRRSRIGGRPDLPADVAWPAWEVTDRHWLRADTVATRPLSFVAQLDLADVAATAGDHDLGLPGLPSDGLLLFFLDEANCFGLDPDDRPGFQVIHVPDDAETTPTEAPEGATVFPEMAVGMRLSPTVPDIQRVISSYDDFDQGEYEAIEDHLFPVDPVHRVGGHPVPVQGPVETEAGLASSGAFRKGTGADVPRLAAEEEARDRWRLLLQLDSDGEMMWGDAGSLYWLVDVSGDGAFEDRIASSDDPPRLWHLMQCH